MNRIEPKDHQIVAVQKFRGITGAFIGDSMGVGKTVTAIERDTQLREDFPEHLYGPTLIISEKIGLDVWLYHLKAMGVDGSEIIVIDPANRWPFEEALEDLRRDLFNKKSPEYFFYIMHYDAIRLVKPLLAGPHPIMWFHVIADEFHLIKNRNAQRTKLLKKIKTRFKSGCTGTPADNKPDDIWSLLNWLYPREYRSYWRFFNTYIESEEKIRHDRLPNGHVKMTGYREAVGVKNIGQLHKEIEPFYIRRLLTDVVKDMPEKIQVEPPIVVDLTPKQRKAYDQMAKKSVARIGGMGDESFVIMAPAVVAVLTRLQQMALATLEAEWDVGDEDFEVDEEWEDWDLPRIVLAKPSPKLDAVMDLITTHEDESFVIFTQFRGMADLVEEECRRQGITVVKIHGKVTSHKKRTQLVEEFQSGRARVFVGTIAAAGRVITLDRAHLVIFIDRSWNPNRNAQAEDRVWRLNQRNAVRIYTIQARNSVDQIRWETIKTKAELVKAMSDPQ